MKTDELNTAVVGDTRESVSFGTRDKDFSKEPLCLHLCRCAECSHKHDTH